MSLLLSTINCCDGFSNCVKGLEKIGPFSVNSNPIPNASGTIRISENRIAASTPKSLIGNKVTFAANSGLFIKSEKECIFFNA